MDKVVSQRRYRSVVLLICTTLYLSIVAQSCWASSKETYRFAVVPQFSPARVFQIWQPILQQLNNRLPFTLKLETASDIPEFERQSLLGHFDFAFVNPYYAPKLYDAVGYQPVLADKKGALRGIIVVRRDAEIAGPTALQGEVMAFPAPNALGASMMIRRDLETRFNTTAIPKYVHSHASVYLNVALGIVTAGGGVNKTFSQQPDKVRNALKVIYQTEIIPSHPVVVHPRVPEQVKQAVVDELFNMAQNDSGRALLGKVPVYQPGPVSFSDYRLLQQSGLEAYYEEQR